MQQNNTTILYLTQESDPELDAILLSVRERAAEMGIEVRSAKAFLSFGDPKTNLEVGTLLLALLKIIIDARKDSAGSVGDGFADHAREKVRAECESRGLSDIQLEELTLVNVNGRKVIRGIIHCRYFDASVQVDGLGNVTFTKVVPTTRKWD